MYLYYIYIYKSYGLAYGLASNSKLPSHLDRYVSRVGSLQRPSLICREDGEARTRCIIGKLWKNYVIFLVFSFLFMLYMFIEMFIYIETNDPNPASQPTNQPANPASQPTNQPARQPTTTANPAPPTGEGECVPYK